jgi:glycosyltransferase involved in cell wall biosynthesis
MAPDVRTLVFDVNRLLARQRFSTPTGIDRVDMAYLEALSAMPDFDLRLMARGPLGLRLLSTPAGALRDTLHAGWGREPPGSAVRWQALRQWLQAPPGTPAPVLPAEIAVTAAKASVRIPWRGDAPPRGPALLVHTSHGQLYRPAYRRWLQGHGLRGLFFVHDLIPLEYPEYNRAAEPARHAARLVTIAHHAAAVLVNSQATADALVDWWQAHRLPTPPVTVAPLGITLPPSDAPAPACSVPYFVVLGTIEPRKNHQLLLDLWRAWVQRAPAQAPRLVIAGRRGWNNEALFRQLDHSPTLASHIIEAAGLGDAALRALMRGARALLNPSFAEGYGLPVAEALALGTPVLASDLPAHREVGGACAEYLAPRDAQAWQQALADYTDPTHPRRKAAVGALGQYRVPDWAGHFAIVRSLIHQHLREPPIASR